MAEEAMKARPMTLIDLVTREDDISGVAASNGNSPSGHNEEEELKGRLSKSGLEGVEDILERSGKMIHGWPSVADRIFV